MGVRNLSCMLWTVERGECRADRTIEESALGTYTGQDADAHQHAEQMLRQADCLSGRRDRPIGLTLFYASQEESLDPLERLGNRLPKLRVVWRHLQGRVHDHAALALAVIERTAQDVVKK